MYRVSYKRSLSVISHIKDNLTIVYYIIKLHRGIISLTNCDAACCTGILYLYLGEQPYDPREPGQYAYQLQVDNSPPLQIEPYIWVHHPSTVSLTSSQAVWASTFFAIPFPGARHVQTPPREPFRGLSAPASPRSRPASST